VVYLYADNAALNAQTVSDQSSIQSTGIRSFKCAACPTASTLWRVFSGRIRRQVQTRHQPEAHAGFPQRGRRHRAPNSLAPRLVLFRRVLTHAFKGRAVLREGEEGRKREKRRERKKKEDQLCCQKCQPSVPGRGAQIIVFLCVHLHNSF